MGRKAIILLGLALVVLFGMAILRSPRAFRISPAAYHQIALGMSQEQVEAILGGPPGSYGASTRSAVEQTGGTGQLLEKGRVEQWLGKCAFISVEFDEAGKVTAKELMEIRNTDPSLMEQLFGWAGP